MSIVSSDTKYNYEYLLCKATKKPFLVLRKYKTLAYISYDTWNAGFDLTDTAAAEIRELFIAGINRDAEKKMQNRTVWYSAHNTSGCIHRLSIDSALEILPKIKAIIENPDNHQPIKGGI